MEITDLVYIDVDGYHYADYPTFRQYFVEKYQGIYGADVYLDDDSQDGQWISVQAQATFDSAAQGAATYNSFSPAGARGVGLSRVVKINGLERQVPSYSTVTVTIVGTVGTVISNGVVADTLDQKWNLPVTVTIPGAGTINVVATARELGDLAAAIGTVTTIFTPTQGWQTVNNAAAATPGAAVEEDSTLRARQALSVANPSLTVLDGTTGAIAAVIGVTKVKVYENDTDATDGNGITEHSICAVVGGGADAAVAAAIQVHKTPGTGTFGDTTVTVYDSHGMPLDIKFQRAVTATIGARITLAAGQGWSSDYELLIQTAVADAISEGEIGDTVLLTKLYAPAYLNGSAPGQTYVIATLELKKNGGAYGTTNITLDFDELPFCDEATDVEIVVT